MTSGQTNSIYCAHCGTGNEPNASICDRCGERVYRPNVDQPPPLGLAACGKCNDANEAHAFYCVNCGHTMESAVRISPEGPHRQAGPQNSLRRLAESQSQIRLRLRAERRSRGPTLSPRSQSGRCRGCQILPARLPKTGLGFAAPNCQNR